MTDDYTQAEIVRALQRLETGQGRMEAKFDTLTAGFVTREILDIELKATRKTIDDNKDATRLDIEEIRASTQSAVAEIKGARAPWWTVVPIVISVCAVVLPFVVR